MSALAALFLSRGFTVKGSDVNQSKITEHLQSLGIEIIFEQKAANITSDIDLVIKSLAIEDDNEELVRALDLQIPVMTYPQALGELMKGFDNAISIAGTHGKSTSTAMLANVFKKANLDPTVLLGTKLAELQGRNYGCGSSEYFILESCEYKEGFLDLHPTAALITNVDPDHLDHYQNEENYFKAFNKYISLLPRNGVLVVNGDDANLQKILDAMDFGGDRMKIITFGKGEQNDYVLAANQIFYAGQKIGEFDLQVPGEHNRLNALGVLVMAESFAIPRDTIITALNHFGGTWRRMEFKGKLKSGAFLYDDYAHHPVEIQATLQGLRELYPGQRVIAVFQPHQYSRTKFLLQEFAQSFAQANQVIIPNIYQVRDNQSDIDSVSTEDLVAEISKYHSDVINGWGFAATSDLIKQIAQSGDVVVVMGAGNIEQLPAMILS